MEPPLARRTEQHCRDETRDTMTIGRNPLSTRQLPSIRTGIYSVPSAWLPDVATNAERDAVTLRVPHEPFDLPVRSAQSDEALRE
jgi:hypothetical protein